MLHMNRSSLRARHCLRLDQTPTSPTPWGRHFFASASSHDPKLLFAKRPVRCKSELPARRCKTMANEDFKAARDLLLTLRDNYEFARSGFRWPRPKRFNWALDWFDDELAAGDSAGQAGVADSRRRRRELHFRTTCRSFEPGRQRPARDGRQTRRPPAADARKCRAVVDRDAGGDEAWPRGDSRDNAARRIRYRRPAETRQCADS